MNESLTLATYIAEIEYNLLPSDVVESTKKSFLDGLGVILAADTLVKECQQFVSIALEEGGKEESTVIGYNRKVPAYMAAFANGARSHALDFEDTHDQARVHPSAAVIPSALAVAESKGKVNGKEFITALALGIDIVSRLGLTIKKDPIEYGWYMPPILGAFGATAAACKILKLKPEQIVNAFALTLCQATCSAEFTRTPDSIIRAIRDAFAAKSAVLSAQLAARGITGFEQPLEGNAGLFWLYARKDHDLKLLTNNLGEVFEGVNVSFKPWPSCRGTHYFIDAVFQIIKNNNINNNDILDINLILDSSPVNRALCEPLERKRRPATAIDAKFSLPFTVALALVKKQVTLNDFTPETIRDLNVLAVAQKIRYEIDEKLKSMEGFIELHTKQGIIRTKIPRFVYGHPLNPMDEKSLVQKFTDCAGHSVNKIPEEKLDKLIKLILHIESVRDIKKISALL